MTFEQFHDSLGNNQPPTDVSDLLRALWYAKKGDWEAAHEIAQASNGLQHCWLHAYLHREEGDAGNARYWYNRAGRSFPAASLEQEWKEMVMHQLAGAKA